MRLGRVHAEPFHGVEQLAAGVDRRHIGATHEQDVRGPIQRLKGVVSDAAGRIKNDWSPGLGKSIDYREALGRGEAIGCNRIGGGA